MPALPMYNPRTLSFPFEQWVWIKKAWFLAEEEVCGLEIQRGETAEERQKANSSARGVAWEFPKDAPGNCRTELVS